MTTTAATSINNKSGKAGDFQDKISPEQKPNLSLWTNVQNLFINDVR